MTHDTDRESGETMEERERRVVGLHVRGKMQKRMGGRKPMMGGIHMMICVGVKWRERGWMDEAMSGR